MAGRPDIRWEDLLRKTTPGEAVLHGVRNARTTVPVAAFANAAAANGLDSDDMDDYTLGHPGAMVFPTALVLCEKLELDGRQMLATVAVGYEIAFRAGRCWHRHHQPTYYADGAWGAVACAATADRLLGLEEEQIKHALGIAEYNTPTAPMERDLLDPAMVKNGHGWATVTGIAVAELAGQRFTGILGSEDFEDWVSGFEARSGLSDRRRSPLQAALFLRLGTDAFGGVERAARQTRLELE